MYHYFLNLIFKLTEDSDFNCVYFPLKPKFGLNKFI